MLLTVVWIDTKEAKVFQMGELGLTHRKMKIPILDGAISRLKLYRELYQMITEPSPILLLGPGIGKHHFQSYLIVNHPLDAQRVIGCETLFTSNGPQIIAYARRFLRLTEFAHRFGN